MDFSTVFNRLVPLEKEANQDLQRSLATKVYEKGTLLLRESEICRKLYFIDSGLAKTFFTKDGKEFIMRFFPEYSLFTVLDSFTTQLPASFEIMALERTTVTYITQSDLELLCKKHHSIETASRKLLSVATVNMMKRISEMLEENATQRYNHFLKDYGEMLQRISLGDLANYLGITQVSLSRIRSQR